MACVHAAGNTRPRQQCPGRRPLRQRPSPPAGRRAAQRRRRHGHPQRTARLRV